MRVLDFHEISGHSHAERDKDILYEGSDFKTRIIELSPGDEMPPCEMADHVIFYVVEGQTVVEVNGEKAAIGEGQCLITEPATLSMRTETGVKIMGIQVKRR